MDGANFARRLSNVNTMNMSRLIVSGLMLLVTLVNGYDFAPKGCEWQVGDEPTLHCRVRTINNAELLVKSLSVGQTGSVTILTLECNDALFFESSFDKSLLESFKNLKQLIMENCKIRSLPAGAMTTLRHLTRLSLRSHNSEWSTMSLELHSDTFRGLSDLKLLDLGDNNLWNTPKSLFCPLYSLVRLNLTKNKLQDIDTMGFSSWGNGPLEPGHACGSTLEFLDLSSNEIMTLPDNGFSGLRKLVELHLQDNTITTLQDRAFVGLNALKTLNLSSNSLVALPPELFQSSRGLTHLYLHNNSLSVLAPGLLEGLDQLQVLDLSKNELTGSWVNRDTFAGLVRLVVLNLGHNQLNRIDANIFHDLYTLQALNLEHNSIAVIAEGAFGELKNLHALILSNNKIASIELHHFTGLYALNQLLLDQNDIEYIDPKSFENVTHLQDLGMNGNNLGNIPNGIGQLKFLKTLDLGKNRIESVSSASFEGLELLYGLRLVDNHIVNVSRDAFSTLPSLQVLNLASNRIKHVEQSAFASNPTLKAIRLDSNNLSDISGVFTNLQSLVWLNVSANQLTMFDFSHLPAGLEWLDMHDNLIKDLSNYFDVSNLNIKMLDVSFNAIEQILVNSVPNSVETLYLQHNAITHVAAKAFINKTNLEKVVLYGNNIRQLQLSALSVTPGENAPQFYIGGNPFYCDCNMEWLLRINHLNKKQYPQVLDLDEITCELSHARGAPPQPLQKLKPSNFLCPYRSHCFPVCHCCDFDACDCEMTCPDRCNCYHDHTWTSNVVDCSNAGYREVPKIPMDATEIYLDGNDLGELGSHVFIGKKKLEILYLNNSNLRALNNRTFNGATALRILHLEDNLLEELLGNEFDQLKSISELYLDRNKISYMDDKAFSNMQHLEKLQLDDNNIVNFAAWELENASKVSLKGNKWSCDCSTLSKLKTWLKSTKQDPTVMQCSEDSVTITEALMRCQNRTEDTIVVQHGLVQESTLFNVPILAAVLVSLIVISLILAIIFAFRQEVRLWAHAKYGIRICENAQTVDKTGFLYDCYMVYSHQDDHLATRVLGPEFESMGYTLCLHYRDLHLVNGASYMTDAVVGAVDSSRRVVLLVSPALMNIEWAKPDFRAALQTALRNSQQQKLICILSSEPLEPMDPELRDLLRQSPVTTRWGERRFWDKLRFAMPDIIHTDKEKTIQSNHAWYRYQAMPGVPHVTSTPTPTQSTYMSGGDSNRSTEDEEGSSAGSHHYHGSEKLNHSYVSIDAGQSQYGCRNELPHHLYSTIPDAPPQSRTYFV